MAFITLDRKKLKENYNYLDNLFGEHSIDWAIVTKMLCGNKAYLKEVFDLGIKQVCDSRVSNLKAIKAVNPEMETIYIKPPPKRSIPSIVRYADVSMNTTFETVQLLSEEARRQGKTHKIIIMVEMGELREGVMRDDVVDFYSRVFEMPNIEVIGIGTNLSCLYGVLPNQDKLIQLSLYKQLIENKFNKKIPYVSGGSSVTIPLIHQGLLPETINHFRVGETLFLGTNVYDGSQFEFMHNDVIKIYAEIIELFEKPTVPQGDMGSNLEGETFEFDQDKSNERSCRALIDLGLLDIEEKRLIPADDSFDLAGASSDMIVVNLGDNERNLKVGDLLEFKTDYMGALRLLNSRYIDKRVI
ncbi:putative amino acid racemase [Marinilabilia salmonicolor]|jgi:predicted amino acid racemase|uniref:alanine racemase n=1 Tax=Marinilabilia salmonicolor TaxID=989 RepID=UPI000D075496|nr:alanine racemase [Marinilabilia salmonicolor]PRY91954.1 putative amino acid racemase [Marinilabilia salmonicolor]